MSYELLYRLLEKVSEINTSHIKDGWRLMNGVTLFVNPPYRCPFCGEWPPTNRIWLVQEENSYVSGCWYLDTNRIGKRVSDYEPVHPHVAGGSVCMGDNTKKTSDALFGSIRPGNHYSSTERWIWRTGHLCTKMPMSNCELCKVPFPAAAAYCYGYAEMRLCSPECLEVARMFRCRECSCVLDMYQPLNWVGRCETCFNKRAVVCAHCGEKVLRAYTSNVRDRGRFCTPCTNKYTDQCQQCNYLVMRVDLDRNSVCATCRGVAPSQMPGVPLPTEVPQETQVEEGSCTECGAPTRSRQTYCSDCCCADCIRNRGVRGVQRDPTEEEEDDDEPEMMEAEEEDEDPLELEEEEEEEEEEEYHEF